jgi:hypothetical protein
LTSCPDPRRVVALAGEAQQSYETTLQPLFALQHQRLGLKVPADVIRRKCKAYSGHGKPIHRTERVNDSAYSIMAQYQLEYRGTVEYYRLAFNLHRLDRSRRSSAQGARPKAGMGHAHGCTAAQDPDRLPQAS